MARLGRPPKRRQHKRLRRLTVWLTEAEYKRVVLRAEADGISIGHLVRDGLKHLLPEAR